MEKLTVVHVEVGKNPVVKTVDYTIEELQKLVGGYIETVHVTDDILLVVNEHGKLDELPVNFITIVSKNGELIPTDVIHGDVFFTSWAGSEFVSLDKTQIQQIKNMFKYDRKVCHVK
jgi:hypothetical protein